MGLQFLDKRYIAAIIIDAWQSNLNTEMNPADGQWFTNGPDNNGGLYGYLVDKIATKLVFDQSQKVFEVHQKAAVTGIADNRNGLTPNMTVSLKYAYQNSSTTSHTKSHSIKVGTGVDIKSKAEFLGSGGEVTFKFSFEYSHSWSDTTSTSKTETLEFSDTVPINIPVGHVMKVLLMCNEQQLEVPYFADIYLSGNSTANFRSPVNGKKIWSTDAGTLCQWISQYKSSSDDNLIFCRDPDDPTKGLIRVKGMLTATQTVNFHVATEDITKSFDGYIPEGIAQAVAV
ncbi:ETX/MTX2 family pore-forming toxin [Limnobaculum xujianqingii]|uniref:ETX/MTX2 family pore-forming toxin n=1 Tax=Limnobaculum xujianqingii TaxID=2738837 RepID=UPI00112E561C|nr:ETX/MTX2 family pore-forming toxin [Limnobaculum xujianqingii]